MAHQKTHSSWQAVKLTPFQELSKDQSCDVCVVGAGIAGLSVAYELIKVGKRVIVLDKESSISGETSLSTAHLSNALDDGYAQMEKKIGMHHCKVAAESHTEAIFRIAQIIETEFIRCNFKWVDGYLIASDKEQVNLLAEQDAVNRAGIKDVLLADNIKIFGNDLGSALKFSKQAQFHPIRYLAGLQRAITRSHGKIFGNALVQRVKEGKLNELQTAQGFKILCEHLVFATNFSTNQIIKIQTKESAYRSYAIGISIPKHSFPEVLLWDMEKPYHYVRVQNEKDHDILIVGGEDHRVGEKMDDPFKALKYWTKEKLGISGEVVAKWSGQIIETLDGLAYIGKSPSFKWNVYEVSGDSGHGITHGVIAGLMISRMILGHHHKWTQTYDPQRRTLMAIVKLFKENLKKMVSISNWFKSDETSIEQLKLGEGTVVREGLHKIAVYKDLQGNLHKYLATCPHLGSVVRWNKIEKTWDCSAHGSRFNAEGEVLNGPAKQALRKLKNK